MNPDGVNVDGPVTITNPPISLPADYQSEQLIAFESSEISLVEMEHEPGFFILDEMLAECVAAIVPGVSTILNHAGEYYKHDPRVQMLENSMESPSTSLPAQMKDPFFSPRVNHHGWDLHRGTCPTAPKTFLNKHTCVRRPECTTMKYSDAWFTLDEEHLQMFWQTSEKLVFSVNGLDIMQPGHGTQSPCVHNWHSDSFSRWLSTPGPCAGGDTPLNEPTLASITAKLESGQDCYEVHGETDLGAGGQVCTESTNPAVRDIRVTGTCNDPAAKGASITVAGTCWTHTYRHNLGVFDFTYIETQSPDNQIRLNNFEPTYFRTKAQAGDMVYDLNDV